MGRSSCQATIARTIATPPPPPPPSRPPSPPSPPSPPENHDWAVGYQSKNGNEAKARSAQRLVAVSYILACAMPPVGAILGLIVMTRLTGSSARHAKWIILLSIVAGAVWALIIATGALNTTNSAY